LSRGVGEIASYSADIAAVLCAPDRLTFWGWVRVACGPEGELFPGDCPCGAVRRRSDRDAPARTFRLQAEGKTSRLRALVLRIALAVALVYGAISLFTLTWGPWKVEFPWRASASSGKQACVSHDVLPAGVDGALPQVSRHDPARVHADVLPGWCAVACWLLSWGPFPGFSARSFVSGALCLVHASAPVASRCERLPGCG
jgi:hypothetical protein